MTPNSEDAAIARLIQDVESAHCKHLRAPEPPTPGVRVYEGRLPDGTHEGYYVGYDTFLRYCELGSECEQRARKAERWTRVLAYAVGAAAAMITWLFWRVWVLAGTQ
jgi:hypothetical protein